MNNEVEIKFKVPYDTYNRATVGVNGGGRNSLIGFLATEVIKGNFFLVQPTPSEEEHTKIFVNALTNVIKELEKR